jgi:hypothetical protein
MFGKSFHIQQNFAKIKKVLILLEAYREFVVTPSQKKTKKTENAKKNCKASRFNVITSSSIN